MSIFVKILDKDRVFGKVKDSPPMCYGQNCEFIGGLILETPKGALLLCKTHAKEVYKEMRDGGIPLSKEDWED